MDVPVLTQLRLTAFKSHHGQSLNLHPLTLLVGPNASGKSNVIDALSVLALLADERAIADIERGDETVAGLRGGLSGARPFGQDQVKLGCTIETESEIFELDFELDASDRAEVVSERVVRRTRLGGYRVLIESKRQSAGAGISDADVYSGGAPKRFTMLSSRLAVVQAATRIPTDTKARSSVVAACQMITEALKGVFVLDPVPGQMRGYAQIGAAPDRLGTTVSAVVHGLMRDAETRDRLTALVRGLVDTEVVDIDFAQASVDGRPVDVMVAIQERGPRGKFLSQARVMSDGTLRYLAIVSTLLYLARKNPHAAGTGPQRPTLVVEEIENGLFPTQASQILDLLRGEATRHRTSLLATTHSPALLDALNPDDHQGVVICARDQNGYTTLQPLVAHSRYVELAGGGSIGSAVARGELSRSVQEFDFESIFGEL